MNLRKQLKFTCPMKLITCKKCLQISAILYDACLCGSMEYETVRHIDRASNEVFGNATTITEKTLKMIAFEETNVVKAFDGVNVICWQALNCWTCEKHERCRAEACIVESVELPIWAVRWVGGTYKNGVVAMPIECTKKIKIV